jgi:hypothetical protein
MKATTPFDRARPEEKWHISCASDFSLFRVPFVKKSDFHIGCIAGFHDHLIRDDALA